jgi:ferric-dicitrate binding protein FerR (iron transport regulator)
MKDRDSTFFELRRGSARRLDFADGRMLTVLQGRVWLTCSGYSEDVFISAGHSVELGPGAVIECDGGDAARLRLEAGEQTWLMLAGAVLAALGRMLPRLPVFRPAPPDRTAVDGGQNG